MATVDVLGKLRLWDFETLTPLNEVKTPPSPLRILSFTSDAAKLLDADGSTVRIWTPATLMRKKVDEDGPSDQSQYSVVGRYSSLDGPKITSICRHPTKPVVFASFNN